MLRCEYRILKYISKHPYCYYKHIEKKFSRKLSIPKGNNFIDVNTIVRHLYEEDYIKCYDMINVIEDGEITNDKLFDDLTTTSITRIGLSYIEQKRSQLFHFIIPYSITTLITVINLIFIICLEK